MTTIYQVYDLIREDYDEKLETTNRVILDTYKDIEDLHHGFLDYASGQYTFWTSFGPYCVRSFLRWDNHLVYIYSETRRVVPQYIASIVQRREIMHEEL